VLHRSPRYPSSPVSSALASPSGSGPRRPPRDAHATRTRQARRRPRLERSHSGKSGRLRPVSALGREAGIALDAESESPGTRNEAAGVGRARHRADQRNEHDDAVGDEPASARASASTSANGSVAFCSTWLIGLRPHIHRRRGPGVRRRRPWRGR
jgi:hypothetical protein